MNCVLDYNKGILCLDIDVLIISFGLPFLLNPPITKGYISMTIIASGIIYWENHVLVQDILVICQDPVGTGIAKVFSV